MRNVNWGAAAARTGRAGLLTASAVLAIGCGTDAEPAPSPDTSAQTDTASDGDVGSGDAQATDDVEEADTAAPPDPLAAAGFSPLFDPLSGSFQLGPITSYAGGSKAYAAPFAWRQSTPIVDFLLGFYTFDEEAGDWTTAKAGDVVPEGEGQGGRRRARGRGGCVPGGSSPGHGHRRRRGHGLAGHHRPGGREPHVARAEAR